jgi:mannosyltransferase OCH1-like enzyme
MIIHQIWIGTKPPPEIWMNTVKQFCIDYKHTYTLWNNEKIQTLNLRSYPGIYELYEYYLNSDNPHKWAACADILRYIILYERGGCYFDSDSVVINGKRLDIFLREFRTGIVAAYEKKDSDLIANGVILCNQYNHVMKLAINELPSFVAERPEKMVWEQTGPVFLTHIFRKYELRYKQECILVPYYYFYPIHWHGIEDPNAHLKMKFHPDTMLFQYGYSTNNFAAKLEQGQIKSDHMYIVLIALGALYVMSLLNKGV